MRTHSFLDTNILVYAVAGDAETRFKRQRALALIQSESFGLSTQVLQEFYVVTTRKLEVPLTPEQALRWIEQFDCFPCVQVDVELIKLSIEASARFHLSYWDAAVLSCAKALGSAVLYSEDFNHGQTYDGVKVINPFLTD